jgi:hypothetical protein
MAHPASPLLKAQISGAWRAGPRPAERERAQARSPLGLPVAVNIATYLWRSLLSPRCSLLPRSLASARAPAWQENLAAGGVGVPCVIAVAASPTTSLASTDESGLPHLLRSVLLPAQLSLSPAASDRQDARPSRNHAARPNDSVITASFASICPSLRDLEAPGPTAPRQNRRFSPASLPMIDVTAKGFPLCPKRRARAQARGQISNKFVDGSDAAHTTQAGGRGDLSRAVCGQPGPDQ